MSERGLQVKLQSMTGISSLHLERSSSPRILSLLLELKRRKKDQIRVNW